MTSRLSNIRNPHLIEYLGFADGSSVIRLNRYWYDELLTFVVKICRRTDLDGEDTMKQHSSCRDRVSAAELLNTNTQLLSDFLVVSHEMGGVWIDSSEEVLEGGVIGEDSELVS